MSPPAPATPAGGRGRDGSEDTLGVNDAVPSTPGSGIFDEQRPSPAVPGSGGSGLTTLDNIEEEEAEEVFRAKYGDAKPPLNSYFRYLKAVIPEIRKDHPNEGEKVLANIAKDRWHAMTHAEKEPWSAPALAELAAFKEQYPDWQRERLALTKARIREGKPKRRPSSQAAKDGVRKPRGRKPRAQTQTQAQVQVQPQQQPRLPEAMHDTFPAPILPPGFSPGNNHGTPLPFGLIAAHPTSTPPDPGSAATGSMLRDPEPVRFDHVEQRAPRGSSPGSGSF
ncbi:hypothetical protein F4808DRAFT_458157 [Astrocystis sublimbata]|nr:hypothetical protein F4808DRAFT_458157 [Astrocystis sublimbata]